MVSDRTEKGLHRIKGDRTAAVRDQTRQISWMSQIRQDRAGVAFDQAELSRGSRIRQDKTGALRLATVPAGLYRLLAAEFCR